MQLVNATRLARQQSRLDGELTPQDVRSWLKDDERIVADSQVLTESKTIRFELEYQLSFDYASVYQQKATREVVVEIQLTGAIPLKCFSTGRVFMHNLDETSTVVLLADGDLGKQLLEEYEPFVCEPEKLEIGQLLVEELLLALPLVPRDPERELVQHTSSSPDYEQAASQKSPFEVLKSLQTD